MDMASLMLITGGTPTPAADTRCLVKPSIETVTPEVSILRTRIVLLLGTYASKYTLGTQVTLRVKALFGLAGTVIHGEIFRSMPFKSAMMAQTIRSNGDVLCMKI